MNKNNKAFTLIELLAIIVILAIIAVITVPIILNIIENSRKGAAQDSAFGYKDSINKWYLEKLSSNTSYNLGTTYEIQSDSTLKNAELATDILAVNISGQKPTGGWVVLSSTTHTIDNACMIIGEYMVKFENGSINETQKGNDCGKIPGRYEASPESWFVYTTNNDVITITGLTTEAKSLEPEEIVIPKTIGGKTVVAIGDWSFGGTGYSDYPYIKKITISSTVKKLGYGAFAYMENLEEVIFEKNSTLEEIDGGAFTNLSKLGKLEIDFSKIKKLGGEAAFGFSKFEIDELVINNDLVYEAGGLSGAKIDKLTVNVDNFKCYDGYYCDGLEINELIYGDDVETIPSGAFSSTKINSITFKDGLKTIGSGAFSGVTGLTSVTIPSSVTSLAEDAFPSSVTVNRSN